MNFRIHIGKTGFEPATPWSQTKCSTKLSYFPKYAPCRIRTCNRLIRSQVLYPVEPRVHFIKFSAEDRNRTGTKVTLRRILSPVRLPVPPPRPLTSERRGSNPRPPPWQGDVLPLNYVRIKSILCRLHDLNTRPSDYKSDALPTELSRLLFLMRVKGLEPPRR